MQDHIKIIGILWIVLFNPDAVKLFQSPPPGT